MDYTTLVGEQETAGSIKYAINWSRIDSGGILEEAEAYIYSQLRVREMRARTDIPIALADTSVDLPTGFLDPIAFSIPGHMPRLRLWDQERFQTRLGWDEDAEYPEGPPSVYSIFDEAIQLNTKADQAYTGKMIYFKTPPALSGSNETNWLTSRYPTLVRRATLMYAAEARKDKAMFAAQQELVDMQIVKIQREADLAMRGMEMDFNWEESD
jgi:hypothetical protein